MKNNTIRHHDQLVYRVNLLIEHKQIKKNLGKVLLAIATFCNKSGIAFPSQYSLAKLTGYKRETVSRLIKRLANDKWLNVKTKRIDKYKARNTYKLNIAKLTKEVGTGFKNKREIEQKNDHITHEKNDHINSLYQDTKDLNKNTAQAHSSPSHDLVSKVNKSIDNETAHQQKIKHNSARQAGLTKHLIATGQKKCPKVEAQERKQAIARQRVIDKKKPLIERFRALELNLIAINFMKNVTHDVIEEIESLAKQLRFAINPIAQNNMQKFIKQKKA